MQVEEFNEAPLAVFFVCTKISILRRLLRISATETSYFFSHIQIKRPLHQHISLPKANTKKVVGPLFISTPGFHTLPTYTNQDDGTITHHSLPQSLHTQMVS